MKKRGFLQFSWVLAIIIGASILFLAIYGTTKVLHEGQTEQNAKTAKNIEILLNPLETNFQSFQTQYLKFPEETRIYNNCKGSGQGIQVSQKSLGKSSNYLINVNFHNKYIFSNKTIEGKSFYLFSKPFYFPFKVASLIYIIPSSKRYCFINTPEKTKTELENLKMPNFLFGNCPDNSIKVCFGSTCDISVDLNDKSITKDSEKVYFEDDALMYAGIFSDKKTYECELKRLINREISLIDLYEKKNQFQSIRGCDSNEVIDLEKLRAQLSQISDSSELFLARQYVNTLKENSGMCNLW